MSRQGVDYRIRIEGIQPSENTESGINSSVTNINTAYNKEQEELINKLKEQDSQISTERERQMKLIEKKKAERQNKKSDSVEDIAANLIDQSRGVDEKQLQNKIQQEKAIQERLEKVRGTRNFNPLNERSATIIESSTKNQTPNPLFEESMNELTVRPKTGNNKSPEKIPETIKLGMPVKTGWADSENSKDVSALFEVNEQYPQMDDAEKKHKNKKDKKKNDLTTLKTENL